jgi:hypothetical protein
MTDRDLRNLYEGVRRGDEYIAPKREGDLYKHIYLENKDNPNAKDGENTITVFFSSDPTIIQQLHAAGGDSREMSMKYFRAGILGRLDETMSKLVISLVQRAVGKMDEVATRGVYDIFQKHHIPGRLVESLRNNLKASDDSGQINNDILVRKVDAIEEFDIIDIIPAIVANCKQYGFTPEQGIDKFVSELWDVKDVEGRTSVGKGELAMSCLSVCKKGEPGDVKAGQKHKNDPDGDIVNVSLVVGNPKQPYLAIEVKGFGGRPGTEGYGRINFVRDAIKVLGQLPKADKENTDTSSFSSEQIAAAEKAVETKFGKTVDAQKVMFRNLLAKKHSRNEEEETKKNQAIESIMKLLDVATNTDEYRSRIGQYATTILSNDSLRKISGMVEWSGRGNESSIATMMDFQNEVLTDGVKMMDNATNFKAGVETFFWNVLPVLSVKPTADQLADLIWSMRTDNVAMPDELKETLKKGVTTGKFETTNKVRLGQLVGAIQMTSYCGHDGFTHAMFVNDVTSPVKKSLIVKTYKTNLNQTFLNLYDAFVANGVDCPLSIDKQNKGVQIKFTKQ